MASHWRAAGTRYEREWGGRSWSLAVDAANPGLVSESGRVGPVLALDGLSARDRSGPDALGGASLIAHESLFDRVEALYSPEGWGSLRVRATWTPRGEDILDLEVQVQAFTVGELEAVEVDVASLLGPSLAGEILAPDGLSLPGRPDAPSPLLARFGQPGNARPYYLEMLHPDDGTRRPDPEVGGVRSALFGYDLERGVVLRGRLRGIWLARRPDEAELASRLAEFVAEPPPLGT